MSRTRVTLLALHALAAPLVADSLHGQAVATELESRIRVVETSLRPRGDGADQSIRWTIEERMAHYGVAGVSVALIEDGIRPPSATEKVRDREG